MMRLPKPMILAVALTLLLGGTGASLAASDIRPLHLIIRDLERHIAELQLNISKIEDRIGHLEEAPATNDPVIQQLRELDLRGWILHKEQWKLQLKHLRLAEDLLKEARDSGRDPSSLSHEWGGHRQRYEEDLEAYRQQRHAIEEQRLQVEGKMIGRYLQ